MPRRTFVDDVRSIGYWFMRRNRVFQWFVLLVGCPAAVNLIARLPEAEAVVASFVGVLAGWAAVETMRLRRLTTQETALLRKQVYGELSPAIAMTIEGWAVTKRRLIEEIHRDDAITDDVRIVRMAALYETNHAYAIRVDTITDKPAMHVHAIVYDATSGKFLLSTQRIQHVHSRRRETEQVYLVIAAKRHDKKDMTDELEKIYGSGCKFALEHLEYERFAYIALLFSDTQGELHVLKQEFRMNGDVLAHLGRGEVFRAPALIAP